MAITTFAQLKTAIAAYAKPGTTLPTAETTDRIPEYVALFEAEANRTYFVRQMEETATLTITSGSANLPTGYLETKSIRLTVEPYNRVEYLPIDQIEALDPTNTDAPYYYDRVASTFVFYPPTSSTARIRYRKSLTALSADGDTNWLLTSHPDLYLYGALRHADRRYMDMEHFAMAEAAYRKAYDELLALDRKMPSHSLQMQPSGFVV